MEYQRLESNLLCSALPSYDLISPSLPPFLPPSLPSSLPPSLPPSLQVRTFDDYNTVETVEDLADGILLNKVMYTV